MTPNIEKTPDIKLSVNQTFGFESDMEVDAFSEKSEYVPEIDKSYKFDKETTLAVLSLSLIHISEPTRQAESRMPSSA